MMKALRFYVVQAAPIKIIALHHVLVYMSAQTADANITPMIGFCQRTATCTL